MAKVKYEVVKVTNSPDEIEAKLDELGKSGWELVQIFKAHEVNLAIFKK
jgi:hypothetical protein